MELLKNIATPIQNRFGFLACEYGEINVPGAQQALSSTSEVVLELELTHQKLIDGGL